ncbi:MAG: hypothetical protein R3Y62_07925, partial [Eubacteriales bacterium]
MLLGLNITVNGANLSAKRRNKLVRDGRNQYYMEVEIDSAWNDLVPYVCFTYGEESCQVKIEDGTAIIPDAVLAAGKFKLGICGVGTLSTFVTNTMEFLVVDGPDLDGEIGASSPPALWETYLLQVETATTAATEAAQQAVDAANTVTEESTNLSGMVESILEATDGITGATFTPSVAENGDLSWSNDRNLDNPSTVNLKGEKGDAGAQGEKGTTGEQGIQGEKGDTGEQGIQGEKGNTGEQGIQGEKGDSGEPGTDG